MQHCRPSFWNNIFRMTPNMERRMCPARGTFPIVGVAAAPLAASSNPSQIALKCSCLLSRSIENREDGLYRRSQKDNRADVRAPQMNMAIVTNRVKNPLNMAANDEPQMHKSANPMVAFECVSKRFAAGPFQCGSDRAGQYRPRRSARFGDRDYRSFRCRQIHADPPRQRAGEAKFRPRPG